MYVTLQLQITGHVGVSRWLSKLKFLDTLRELFLQLVKNPTLFGLHCAI